MDYQLLLFFVGKELIAVAAHEQDLKLERDDATLWRVIAIARNWRRSTVLDDQGREVRLSNFVVLAVLADAKARRRGGVVRALCGEQNEASRKLNEWMGFTLYAIDGGICEYIAVLA